MTPAMIKTCGYLISSASVALLGVVSWKSASADPVLFTCLILGMALSHAGMAMRWWSYRKEQREKAETDRSRGPAELQARGRIPPP